MIRLFAIAALLFTSATMFGQDIHFSQFFFSPQTLNPAEIGNFEAQYRLNANQKTQWREVSQPYSTFALMADGNFSFLPEKVSAGLLLMNDHAGDSDFNTFSVLIGGSYAYPLPEDERHTFRGGLQTGLTQIRLDESALSFDNQYNGVVYDPDLPTGEDFARYSRWHFNLNLGAGYTFERSSQKSLSAGFVAHNITAPKQSFFNDTGVKLPLRTSLYVKADWKINDNIAALPAVRWMRQATFSEFVFGTAARYVLLNERSLYRTVFAGYFGRINDSGIAMIGMDIDDWRFAVSYDINVSDLSAASRNRGGLEFSLQYLFNRHDQNSGFHHRYCPDYL